MGWLRTVCVCVEGVIVDLQIKRHAMCRYSASPRTQHNQSHGSSTDGSVDDTSDLLCRCAAGACAIRARLEPPLTRERIDDDDLTGSTVI